MLIHRPYSWFKFAIRGLCRLFGKKVLLHELNELLWYQVAKMFSRCVCLHSLSHSIFKLEKIKTVTPSSLPFSRFMKCEGQLKPNEGYTEVINRFEKEMRVESPRC